MAQPQNEPLSEATDEVAAYPPRKKLKFADDSSANLHSLELQPPEDRDLGNAVGDKAQALLKNILESSSGTMVFPVKLDPALEQKLAGSTQVKEAAVGILEAVCEDHAGLFGIFKQRYADFLVNEIDLEGNVVRLETLADTQRIGKFAKGATHSEPRTDTSSKQKTPKAATELVKAPLPESVTEHAKKATGTGIETTLESSHTAKNDGSGKDVTMTDTSAPIGAGEETFNVANESAPSNVLNAPENPPLAAGLAAWQNFSQAGKETFVKERHIPQKMVDALLTVVSQATIDELNALHTNLDPHGRIPLGSPAEVRIPNVTDKTIRTQLHEIIRTIFHGRLQSIFDDKDGAIVVRPSANGGKNGGRNGGRNSGRNSGRGTRRHTAADAPHEQKDLSRREPATKPKGEYLHFSLLKVNRDTMETVSFFSRVLRISPSALNFAGTKDRRGVTVQRLSARRLRPDKLCMLENAVHNGHVGDWEYRDGPLKLGDSNGNEFVVTLRDVQTRQPLLAKLFEEGSVDKLRAIETAVSQSRSQILDRGFINYFGLQRFGTYHSRTNEIGQWMLRGEFEKAVDSVLTFSEEALLAYGSEELGKKHGIGKDDASRAKAISLFKRGEYDEALKTMLRKNVAEYNIMRHLSNRDKHKDYQGALSSVNRNNRLMYVHAYQSIVWNLAASHRRKTWGATVVEGDLVLVNEHKDKEIKQLEAPPPNLPDEQLETVDADGEIVVQPAVHDRAVNRAEAGDMFERARALTAEEAESGKYSIFDIVLPLPGYDILYPPRMVKFYEETMGSEAYGGLDPHNMRRKWQDISLPGSYRKLMARVEDDVLETTVRAYKDNNEQFVETDIEKIMKARDKGAGKQKTGPRKHKDFDKTDAAMDWAEQVERELASEEEADTMTDKLGPASDVEERIAVILKFRLGSSTYATMMLREFFKGGVIDFKAEYSGVR